MNEQFGKQPGSGTDICHRVDRGQFKIALEKPQQSARIFRPRADVIINSAGESLCVSGIVRTILQPSNLNG